MSTQEPTLAPGSLALYRGKAARVTHVGERIEIELEGGEKQRVRSRDLELLHPGPLGSLNELLPLPGEMRAAWEILAGEDTSLSELAELAIGHFTPVTAWAAWQFVAAGQYFSGTPGAVRALSLEEVEQKERLRAETEAQERAWQAFLGRVRSGIIAAEDQRYLKEIEPLAFGAAQRSRLLKELGRGETPENAHALLLETGYWDETINPYPRRLGLPLRSPQLAVPALPDEPRRDLTAFHALAIDDAGTDNPDDALSLEGEKIWVHVADPAALIQPGDSLDLEARERGLTLHLPEGPLHLVPMEMIRLLGLGLQEVSPALSFGIMLDADGEIESVEILPSWTRVERLSYEEALGRMDEPLLARLEKKMQLRRERRERAGAVNIDLPETHIKVRDGQIAIHPILPLRSRLVVEEAMILAGEAAARFALQHQIPMIYSTQEPPDSILPHTSLAEMFAMRRLLRRSQSRTIPNAHAGLGLPAYAQATSPLRRYLDLVAHQQIRRFLRGMEPLNESDLIERIGAVEAVAPAVRQAELQSERHWTLVFLRRHPQWQGTAVLVEKRGASGTLLLPDLALETRMHLAGNLPLDTRLDLRVTGVNLAALDVNFQAI